MFILQCLRVVFLPSKDELRKTRCTSGFPDVHNKGRYLSKVWEELFFMVTRGSSTPGLWREPVPSPPILSCWPGHMIFISFLAKSIFCKSCSLSPLMCNQEMCVDWLPSLQRFLQGVAREQSLPLQKIISEGWDFWKKKKSRRSLFSKDNFRGPDTKSSSDSPTKILKKKIVGETTTPVTHSRLSTRRTIPSQGEQPRRRGSLLTAECCLRCKAVSGTVKQQTRSRMNTWVHKVKKTNTLLCTEQYSVWQSYCEELTAGSPSILLLSALGGKGRGFQNTLLPG